MRPHYGGSSGPIRPGLTKSATLGLIIAFAVAYVVAWMGVRALTELLAFNPAQTLARPWTLFTYPLSSAGDGRDAIFFLILCWWFYMVGSSLETTLKPRGILLAFGAFAVLGSLSIWLGSLVMPGALTLVGPSLPVAAMTVLWGARFKTSIVQLMLVIPIQGRWIALLTALLVLFGYGSGAPLMGLFACVPLALAWAWGDNRLPFFPFDPVTAKPKLSKAQVEAEERFLREVKERELHRRRREKENERLRKLFEVHSNDDLEDKKD